MFLLQMFRYPQIPKPKKKAPEAPALYKGLLCFNCDNFRSSTLIGNGGFGKVFKCTHLGKEVVVKVLEHADVTDLVKECRFHHRLVHGNVVKFGAICTTKNAFMLEYIRFDLTSFGCRRNVSSLHEVLEELAKGKFKGFEHLIPCIAKDVASGLFYLHSKGVAHRDLKPGNVLVCNQHFNRLDQDDQVEMRRKKPCMAKLTDFGESWGKLSQSTDAACTHTVNIYRGTPAFMAPEVMDPIQRPNMMQEDALLRADIWSLGMLLFCLINPSCKLPYLIEGKHLVKAGLFPGMLKNKISLGIKPMFDCEYDAVRSAMWENIADVFKECIKKDPLSQISLQSAISMLNEVDTSSSHPFSVHQGTAFEKAQEFFLDEAQVESFKRPENDGTNSCAFLSLKIAERIALSGNKENLQHEEIEAIIANFPKKVNHL